MGLLGGTVRLYLLQNSGVPWTVLRVRVFDEKFSVHVDAKSDALQKGFMVGTGRLALCFLPSQDSASQLSPDSTCSALILGFPAPKLYKMKIYILLQKHETE